MPGWRRRLPTGRRLRASLLSPDGRVLSACAVGLLFCLLPWQLGAPQTVNGFNTWYGLVVILAFLTLGGMLLATNFIQPVPVWRPVIVIVTGLTVLLCMGLYLSYEAAALGPVGITGFAYFPLLCGLGLFVMGTFQLRQVLRRVYGEPPDRRGQPGETRARDGA